MENRELRFRAWDILTKKMSPEFVLFGEFTLMGLIHSWQDHTEVEAGLKEKEGSPFHDALGRLNDLKIMQLTGMKDKNGKPIFESDVVIWVNKGSEHVVYWSIKECVYACKSVDPDEKVESWLDDTCMVIGNIYENPELLK